MAREKTRGATTLRSWAEADQALLKIGTLTREIAKKEGAATSRIEEIKAKLVMDTSKQVAEKTALLHDLEMFAQVHRENLIEEAGKKSIVLNHGKLGFRKSTKIVVRSVAKVLELLKSDRRGKQHIRVKESVDKESLRDVPDDDLLNWGIRREVTDEFWCEPFETTAKAGPKDAA